MTTSRMECIHLEPPPPATRLVARRLASGLELRHRVMESDGRVRLVLALSDATRAGRVVQLPPIAAQHLPAFLAAVTGAVEEALARAAQTPPATSAGPTSEPTEPAPPVTTQET